MSAVGLDERYREVYARMARGDWAAALDVVANLLEKDAGDARAHFLHGRIELDRERLAEALQSFTQAVELEPSSAEFHAYLAYCHLELNEDDQALRAAQAAAALEADDRTLDLLATIHSRLGRYREAADMLQRAVDQGSEVPGVYFNLATNLKFCGDLKAARDALERAIRLNPAHIKARAALSALRRATKTDNQIADYQALLDRTSDPAMRLHLCHAAARECDAMRDYDRAFAFLENGKARMRALTQSDFAGDKALFDAMHRGFENAAPVKGYEDSRPIFIVGMPRSGTTVVDRILSGHPDVVSAGETLHFSSLLQDMAGRRSPQLLDPLDVAPLVARDDLSALGKAYVDKVVRGEQRRVIDKFHLNSLLSGFILRALPDARIICVVRGAMDTIMGNYRQLFEYRSGLYRYSLSIETIARFYVEFRRLADLWAALYPDRFMLVSYEQLIADPEQETRKMLTFCGLDWHAGITQIENNRAPVSTASAVQVRQPLNAQSIGSWRHYERHLDAARDILMRANIDL